MRIKVEILKQDGATGLRTAGDSMLMEQKQAKRLAKKKLVKLPVKPKSKQKK